jgi:tetratricopeptide (TPR) repeat protein
VLRNTFRRDNAKLKYMLARCLLGKDRPDLAAEELKDLLSDSSRFDLNKGAHESETFCSVQTARALLGDALYRTGDYAGAMEEYRKAHDRHLNAIERPFYSLNIVDCLIGLGKKKEAINHLKRTRYEFNEFNKAFDSDTLVLNDLPELGLESWQELIDLRQRQLED